MAKYEDYAARAEDELQNEIDQAGAEAAARQSGDNLPDRFKGKSAEEIAQSYLELEQMASRQANDLGRMRQTVDEYVRLQSTVVEEDHSQAEPVTVDDLYDNPEETIRKVASRATNDRIEQLEQQLARLAHDGLRRGR